MIAVDFSHDGEVATVTIDRPERRNALDSQTIRQLGSAFARLERDTALRAVVLTGADGAFSAGGDLAEDVSGLTPHGRMADVTWAAAGLAAISVPVVAKVDGPAIGAGCSLVLGCDLAVASTRSTFGLPFARRGLSPDFGASWNLTAALGLRRAMSLCLLGERLNADAAFEVGIVGEVVPSERLDAVVADMLDTLVAAPVEAMRRTKRLLRASASSSYLDQLDSEAMAQALNLHSADVERARHDFIAGRAQQRPSSTPQSES